MLRDSGDPMRALSLLGHGADKSLFLESCTLDVAQ